MTREEFNFIISAIMDTHPCGLCEQEDINQCDNEFKISDEAWYKHSPSSHPLKDTEE